MPHHDHTADGLRPVVVEGAAAKVRPELHVGHVLQPHRHAAALGHDRRFQIGDRVAAVAPAAPFVTKPAPAADDVFHPAALDRLRPHVPAGGLHGGHHRVQRQVMEP